jgi:hypothetical protein
MNSIRHFRFLAWVVSVLAAGVIGYALRGPGEVGTEEGKSVKRSVVQTGLEPDAPAGTSVTRVEGKTTAFPKSWPADAPAEGTALRDYVVKILRDEDPVERTYAYLSLLRCANKDNVGRFYDAWDLLRKEGVEHSEVMTPMNYRSGELNGAQAVGRRTGSSYDLSVAGAASVTLEGWIKGDPKAARAWVESLPDGVFRERMIETMVAGMAVSDPAGSRQLLAMLPEDMQANAASHMAVRIREKQGLGATLDWLAQIPGTNDGAPPAWVETASARLIQDGINSKQRAGGVAKAMAQRLDNPVVTSDRLIRIGKSYAQASPEEAFPWAAGIEGLGNPKAAPGQILGGLIEASYADKIPFVEQWLMDNPEVPGRDQAIAKLCQRLSATGPDRVVQWVQRIKDPALRQSMTPD